MKIAYQSFNLPQRVPVISLVTDRFNIHDVIPNMVLGLWQGKIVGDRFPRAFKLTEPREKVLRNTDHVAGVSLKDNVVVDEVAGVDDDPHSLKQGRGECWKSR